MIILTGPQTTDDERGDLIEAAGLIDARLTSSTDIDWFAVTAFFLLDGWETCPLAVADVAVASAFGLTAELLTG